MGDELDQLLQERFDLTRQDVVAALKTLWECRCMAS
jgi:hypothetical protein